MAAPRPESNAGAKEPETSAQAAAPATAAPASGGFKAWLPLIITALLMPVLAFAMTQFLLLPQLKKGLGAPMTVAARAPVEASPAKSESKTQPESCTMNKLLVNVAGTLGGRFLQVSLSINGSDTEFKNKMQAHDAQLRDAAGQILRIKTLADLEKPDACNRIRSELMSSFNNILGGAEVQDIFFTEFAIQ